MAWFIGQSVLIIAAAFLIGLLVGWLIWGALWRRNLMDESAAITAERDLHNAALATIASRDAEIATLRAQLGQSASAPAGASAAPLAAEVPPVAESALALESAPDSDPAPEPASAPEEPAVGPAAEPVAEPALVAEPVEEPAAEPELVDAPMAEPVAEPEPAAEPAAEPELVDEPVADGEPAAEPVADGEPAAEPELVAAPAEEPEDVVAAAVEPETQAAAIPVQGLDSEPVWETDDLERIEGIGPAMSGALQHAGIRTYVQLAGADEDVLREAIEARGLRFAPSLVTWARQAQLLADGDEEGFADLTRRLVAGRDEGRE